MGSCSSGPEIFISVIKDVARVYKLAICLEFCALVLVVGGVGTGVIKKPSAGFL